jgi:mannose-1-phosphate guanylyltransferase
MEKNFVVIMAGGIGSRFWPVSRKALPKQFLDLLGIGKSLICQTFERFEKIVPTDHIFIVTNYEYADLVKEHIPQLNDSQLLLEPSGKNTAACVAYAAHKLDGLHPDAKMIVAPSDHIILDLNSFEKQIIKALDFCQNNDALITLGIQPHRPDTGYGYIQYDLDETLSGIHDVKAFTEKPPLEMAEKFLESGEFLWNAGIFVWSVKSVLKGLDNHLHDLQEVFYQGRGAYNTATEYAAIQDIYTKIPSISIDNGLLEKAENVYVIPSDFGWSDVGTWKTVFELIDTENDNKSVNCKVISKNAEGNLAVSTDKNKLIVLSQVQNLFVIDTPDVLLISDNSCDQEIKEIVKMVTKQYDKKYT